MQNNHREVLTQRAELNLSQSKVALDELDQGIAIIEAQLAALQEGVKVIDVKREKKQSTLDAINARKGTEKEKERDNVDAYGIERDLTVIHEQLAEARKPIEDLTPELHRLRETRQGIIDDDARHSSLLEAFATCDRLAALDEQWMTEHRRLVALCKKAGVSHNGPEMYHTSIEWLRYKTQTGLRR